MDSWYFEILLAFKPTYFNMDFIFHLLSLSDLFDNGRWNLSTLHEVFGDFLNLDYLANNRLSSNMENKWVWYPKSQKNKLTAMVYSHFNKSINGEMLGMVGKMFRV